MPKVITQKSEKEVRALTHSARLGGVPGFMLVVVPLKCGEVGKYYVERLTLPCGKLTDRYLGKFEEISYACARQRAANIRLELKNGIDRVAQRRQRRLDKKGLTLEQIFMNWLNLRVATNKWRHCQKTQRDFERQLLKFFPKEVLKLPAGCIDAELLADHLQPHWMHTHESCKRFCCALRAAFKLAIEQEKIPPMRNPADLSGPLGELLVRVNTDQDHFGAIRTEKIPQFFAELLCDGRIHSPTALLIAFNILTAGRILAVIDSKWQEIDVNKRIHTIPRQRMKIKGLNFDRRTPLSEEALFVLKQLPRLPSVEHLFFNLQNPQNKSITSSAYDNFIKRMCAKGYDWHDPDNRTKTGKPRRMTIHGTSRACFETWANDAITYGHEKFEKKLIDRCLDHAEGYHGAYMREQPVGEMREVFDAWGKFCFSRMKTTT